jgi:glycosyltransferase involved in cell wall biosynthesis
MLDNENVNLVFIAKWNSVNPYNENPNGYLKLQSERAYQLEFKEIRIKKLSFFEKVRMIKSIYLIIKNIKPSLIITSTQYPLHSKIAYIISKIKGIDIAIYTEAWKFERSKNPIKFFYEKFNFLMLKSSKKVLVQSTEKKIIYSKFGIALERIVVFPFLINDNFQQLYLRQKRDRMSFLYIGRFIEIKGIDTLLKAFLLLSEKGVYIQLVLAGGLERDLIKVSDEIRMLWEKINENKLETRIKFLGYINEEQKYTEMLKTDFFVMPTKTNDGWGMSLMDAISASMPCISTNAVGASKALIEEGENGFVINSDDHIILANRMRQLISLNDDAYLQFCRKSRLTFEKYNNPNVIRESLNFLMK